MPVKNSGKSLLLVVARKGSKGLPGKNTKILHGKPLIQWTIEQALSSDQGERVVVSSDDPEVIEIAASLGADTVDRPKRLSEDSSPVTEVISHALESLRIQKNDFGALVLLEPTSPLRPRGFIDSCIRLFVDHPFAKSAVSVSRIVGQHPDFSMQMTEGTIVVPTQGPELKHKRRQDIAPLFFIEGSFYATSIENFLRYGMIYPSPTLGILVEKWQSYEIDDKDDFLVVEALMKAYKNEL